MSAELNNLKQHLIELEIFMSSRAYVGYRAARRQDIKDIEGRILLIRPDSPINIALQNQAFGELDSQKDMEKTFEAARVDLKALIDKTAESENEAASNTKV